jgi:hypothetical protein
LSPGLVKVGDGPVGEDEENEVLAGVALMGDRKSGNEKFLLLFSLKLKFATGSKKNIFYYKVGP